MGNKIFQNSNIDMIIMKVLEEKDMYGYELIQKIEQISNYYFKLKTGTIYPILHSMEKEGLVISYEKKTEANKVRKYYQLTELGEESLKCKIKNWNEYSFVINIVLEG